MKIQISVMLAIF